MDEIINYPQGEEEDNEAFFGEEDEDDITGLEMEEDL